MARPGISYDDVKKAAVKLLERGANPSIQRIRESLGTGSHSTIATYLKRWRQELDETSFPSPPPLPDAVMRTMDEFWRVALESAEVNYRELREQAEHAVAKAEQTREEALAETHRVSSENTELKQCLAQAQSNMGELHDRLLVEQERRRRAEATIVSAEQRANQAAESAEQARREAASQVAEMEETWKHAGDEMEKRLAEAVQQISYERERGEATETRLMAIIDQNRAEQSAWRKEHQLEKAAWLKHESNLNERLQILQEELADLRLRSANAEERSRLLEAELTEARTSLGDLQDRYLTAVHAMESLRADLKAAQDKQRTLETRLKIYRRQKVVRNLSDLV